MGDAVTCQDPSPQRGGQSLPASLDRPSIWPPAIRQLPGLKILELSPGLLFLPLHSDSYFTHSSFTYVCITTLNKFPSFHPFGSSLEHVTQEAQGPQESGLG